MPTDPYTPIHKAAQHQLTSVVQRLSANDWADAAASAATLAAVEVALRSQEEHAGHEDRFYHPLIESKVPGCTAPFAERHEVLAVEIDGILAAVDALGDGREVSEADGHALYLDVCAFVGRYLGHLDDEERVLEPLFREHCTEEELAAIEGEVMAVVSPESMQAMLPHFLAGLDRAELISWLGGVRAGAPPEVFADVCAVGGAVVDRRRWAQVLDALD